MEATTIQRYIHTSPRKLRLVADMVRKMTPNQALDVLRLTPKMAAKDLTKALQTVLANAKQSGMDSKKAIFKNIEINESTKMRRFRAGTRGRVKPYKRRMAHIKIVLTDEIGMTQKDSESRRTRESAESENQKIRSSDMSDKAGTPSTSEFSEKKKEDK